MAILPWMLACTAVVSFVTPATSTLSTPDDLRAQYYNIFKSGNRNAASHLWTSYILNRSSTMSAATLKNMFKGFCAISGSPLPDAPRTIYKVTMSTVSGSKITGQSRHCCWPCVCDLHELVRVDTMTVNTAEGPQKLNMFVIGDPCKHPAQIAQSFTDPFSGTQTTLREQAPELACTSDGQLLGAKYSDNGYPVIGMFFDDEGNAAPAPVKPAADDPVFGYGQMCADRRQHGYNSGMGLIFHLVANINPIHQGAAGLQQKYSLLGEKAQAPASKTGAPNALSNYTWLFAVAGSFVVASLLALRWWKSQTAESKKQEDLPANAFELSRFEVLE